MKEDIQRFALWLFKVALVVLGAWACGAGLVWVGVFAQAYKGILVFLAAIVSVEMVATRQLIEDWKKDIDRLMEKTLGIDREE